MKIKYETCPKCRGYRLESLWCHVCNGTGMVRKQSDTKEGRSNG